MATREQIIDQFAAVIGVSPMTVLSQTQVLIDAGFIHQTKRNNLTPSHYNAKELAYLILAQAASTPNEVPEIVRVLGNLREFQKGKLIDYLTGLIAYAATPEGMVDYRKKIAQWVIIGVAAQNLNLSPGRLPIAWISTDTPDNASEHRSFVTEEPLLDDRQQPVRHITTISLELILVAGEMLADSFRQDLTSQ